MFRESKKDVERYYQLYPFRPWEHRPPLSFLKHRSSHDHFKPHSACGLALGFLAFVVITAALVVIPLFFNRTTITFRWQLLEKPSWVITGTSLALVYALVHLCLVIAVWFIWVDGGFQKHLGELCLYFQLLLFEVVWPSFAFDLVSYTIVLFIFLYATLLSLSIIYMYWRVLALGGIFVIPMTFFAAYGALLAMEIDRLNPDAPKF